MKRMQSGDTMDASGDDCLYHSCFVTLFASSFLFIAGFVQSLKVGGGASRS